MKKFFKVEAKCGHVGKGRFFRGTFYVSAPTGSAAAALVRKMPRVKHHHKDAILDVKEITEADYIHGKSAELQNPYYSCSNIQEQRANMDEILDFIEAETRPEPNEYERAKSRQARIRRNNLINKLQQKCAAKEVLWAC